MCTFLRDLFQNGFQPLILASFNGHSEVVEELLLSEADPNVPAKVDHMKMDVLDFGGRISVCLVCVCVCVCVFP